MLRDTSELSQLYNAFNWLELMLSVADSASQQQYGTKREIQQCKWVCGQPKKCLCCCCGQPNTCHCCIKPCPSCFDDSVSTINLALLDTRDRMKRVYLERVEPQVIKTDPGLKSFELEDVEDGEGGGGGGRGGGGAKASPKRRGPGGGNGGDMDGSERNGGTGGRRQPPGRRNSITDTWRARFEPRQERYQGSMCSRLVWFCCHISIVFGAFCEMTFFDGKACFRNMFGVFNDLFVGRKTERSGTGFVTFKSHAALASATQEALQNKRLTEMFAMSATSAPERRDVLWFNAAVPQRRITTRVVFSKFLLSLAMSCWAAVSVLCSALPVILRLEPQIVAEAHLEEEEEKGTDIYMLLVQQLPGEWRRRCAAPCCMRCPPFRTHPSTYSFAPIPTRPHPSPPVPTRPHPPPPVPTRPHPPPSPHHQCCRSWVCSTFCPCSSSSTAHSTSNGRASPRSTCP